MGRWMEAWKQGSMDSGADLRLGPGTPELARECESEILI